MENGIKSKERVKQFGEVFTPENIVKDMCNLGGLKEVTYNIESTFLEPSCGNGNFLVELLERKMKSVCNGSSSSDEFNLNTIKTICSLYGVDIQLDNIIECRKRMSSLIEQFYANSEYEYTENMQKSVEFILCRNVIVGDMLTAKMAPYKPNRRGGRQSGELSERLQFFEWKFDGNWVDRLVNRLIIGEKSELIYDDSFTFPLTKFDHIFNIPRGMDETTSI